MAHISFKNCIPVRAIIWVMCFTCTLFLYMLRINLSIIILAMVQPNEKGNKTFVPECKVIKQNLTFDGLTAEALHSNIEDYGVRYDWSSELQGLILGSYFWGFTIAGFPGGAIAEKFGPSKCVTISFLVSGILTLIGPWAAALNPWLLIISRFVIGIFGGVVFPSLHCLVARWAPPDEKGKFVGALLGGSLGTVITWPLLGYIIETLGWTWAFIGSGGCVIAWTISWYFLVTDSPEQHRTISEEEVRHITESLSGSISKVKRFPPYKDIFLTIPFWALLILHFGNLWGLFFLMTAGPNFLSSVLGFTLGHTGILASLPYLARLILGIIFGQIGDFIIRKHYMEKTTIRKSFILFSHFLPGVLLFAQTFVGCDVTWAIVLITMSLGLNGASTLTNLQNSQDLSPNFAGTLYGIINCVGSTTGFINPTIVGYMTAERNGLDEWHHIFYIGSSVYIACGIVFCIFGTADKQPWNDETDKSKPDTEGVENIGFEDVDFSKSTSRENTKI
ncbi:sialin-like [Diorhabda carinulata]|uniref:sialin-like n=1 Tax=Diorhabda carinulata TaxID=1163345 RepID=UPI0025A2A264|nr:sialin-like [Diorhabda carinulata]XP_057653476.1 sialin-like [Diorhabda carinulata]XP_057653477.1 sialin-like [Diorhabda carinulata]XP_057653478.1 sialin-like [Diorhabda carinulata]